MTKVYISKAEVADEPSWCGNNNISTALHSAFLLLVANTVVTTIDSYAADVFQIVSKALHGAVNLLGEFSRGGHNDTVDSILGITAVSQQAQYRQQICSCLARTRLCYAHYIATFQNRWDSVLLNGSRIGEVHVIKRIEDIIIEV